MASAPNINAAEAFDWLKLILILAAVIAVLALIYFVLVKPVEKLSAAAPSGTIPFGLGALAGTWFGKKYLAGSSSQASPGDTAENSDTAASNTAAEDTGASDAAAADEGTFGAAGEDIGAGLSEGELMDAALLL